MAVSKVTLFLALAFIAAVMADQRPYGEPSEEEQYSGEQDSGEPASYNFEWSVNEDDNNFGQQEQRDGDETQGSYYVDLPDGRTQKVTYYVDGDSGYVAEVSYSGEAQYPSEEEQSEEQSYQRSYE